MEKCGKFRKNCRFSGRIWPDWGNTAWADMAGLGSIGITFNKHSLHLGLSGLLKTITFPYLCLTNKDYVKI